METDMDTISTLSQLIDHMAELDLADAAITQNGVFLGASMPQVSHAALLAEVTGMVTTEASIGPFMKFDEGYLGAEFWSRCAPGARKIIGYGGYFISITGKGRVRWEAYVRADTEALVAIKMRSIVATLSKAA
jgi:hypothetical protein